MADRTVTVGSGKTYSTPALAVAGEADFQAGEDNIVFVIDAGQYGQFSFASSSYTTSASHKLIFKASSGAFHSFVRGQGVRVVCTTNWESCITSSTVSYVDFINIACCNPTTGNAVGFKITSSTTAYITCINCFAYDCNASGFYLGNNCNIVNCVAIGCVLGVNVYLGRLYAYNCTMLNNTTGMSVTNYKTANIKNCYFSNTANFYKDAYSTINQTTCASSDGSQSTTTISLVDCAFYNTTAGSEDIRISSSSDLIDIGTDLSSDAVYPFSTDAFGNTRSGSWDIGAVEYIASGGGPLVGASALVGGGVLCGQGNLIN